MTPLRSAVEDYVGLRRSLGFKLRDMAPGLIDFVSFLEQKAAPHITTPLALEWAMQPKRHQPSDWAKRLGFVRVFARHWSATDPSTEIPPVGLLPFRPQRARPYLYTEDEIQDLLAAAKMLRPSGGLRPWTYHCLFGLLAVTGLRISELIYLKRPRMNAIPAVERRVDQIGVLRILHNLVEVNNGVEGRFRPDPLIHLVAHFGLGCIPSGVVLRGWTVVARNHRDADDL